MLLPGLWDMHSHDYGDIVSEMLQLAAGVTTLRDMSRDTLTALRLAKRPAEEVAFAPYVLWAGRLANDSSSPRLVRRYAELGASMIKVSSYQQRRFLVPAIAEARRLGLRVTGHLGAGISVEDAVNLGYDEISHIPHLTVNIRGDSDYVGAPQYLWRGMQNAAGMNKDTDSMKRTIQILRTRGLAMDPTLAFVEPSANVHGLLVRAYIAPVLDRLPAGWGRGYVGWTMVEPEGMSDVAAAGFGNLKLLVKDLHAAGIPLLPGTDDIAGFTLQRELELYVEAGIPAADVLYLATLGSARVMNRHSAVGSIAVGKRADMILVDGDPLAQITDLGRVVLTMKGGAIYDPGRLYGELGFWPYPQTRGLTKQ